MHVRDLVALEVYQRLTRQVVPIIIYEKNPTYPNFLQIILIIHNSSDERADNCSILLKCMVHPSIIYVKSIKIPNII